MVFSLLCCSVIKLSPSTLTPHPSKKSMVAYLVCDGLSYQGQKMLQKLAVLHRVMVADFSLLCGFPATEVMHNWLLTS